MNNKLSDHWDIKYLISFLYIFLAESDFVVSREEAEALNKSLNEALVNVFFQTEEEKNAIIAEVNQFSHSISEEEKMELIKELSVRVDISFELYELIVQQLNAIAQSDHNVSVEEHSLMYYIRLKLNKDYNKKKEL